MLSRLEDGGGGMANNEASQPRPDRLVVAFQPPVVADQRIGHDHDLAGVGGIRADFLVARLGGVDDEIAATTDRCAKRHTAQHHSVGKRKQGWAMAADARVNYCVGREGQGRCRLTRAVHKNAAAPGGTAVILKHGQLFSLPVLSGPS